MMKRTKLALVETATRVFTNGVIVPFGEEAHTEAKEMWIEADGNGLSGHYDRIHVLLDDGDHYVLPAHNCEVWLYE